MLTVGYKNNTTYDMSFYNSHGRIKDDIHDRFGNLPELAVYADGDELETVKNQFSGIPMHNGRTVTWTGETARFIINNIDL